MLSMNFSQSLFKLPFSNSGEIMVEPYKQFADGFYLGFSDKKTKISVQQKPKKSVFDSPPDHFFTLDIAVKDVRDTKWISLEKDIDTKAFYGNTLITALLSMRSSTLSHSSLFFRIIDEEEDEFKDINIGPIIPSKDNKYSRMASSAALSDLPKDKPFSAKLILFFPVENEQNFSLSIFNVFFSKRVY